MPFESAAIGRSIVKVRAVVPEDAFTAGILGSERVGNGIVINSQGLVLTIGYLITEAADVWLTTADGREVAGHPLAYDQVTGFGLVLPLENADVAPLALGSSAGIMVGDAAPGSICSNGRCSRRPLIRIGPGPRSSMKTACWSVWVRCWCESSSAARRRMPICSCPSTCSSPFSRT